jgi:hypothetical protein
MTTTFLGGVQLVKNIQVFAYKNDEQHWLALHKDDTFIDFVTYGAEISGLNASCDGMWFAYFQKSDKEDMTYFSVWKYVNISETEHEIVPYCELHVPINASFAQSCFNSSGTHVTCLAEWNHVHVIDLRRLDAPTEFYGHNGCELSVVYDAGDCFVWMGQDEHVRVIDLTTKYLTMWRYKVKNTKYLFVHKDRVVHMTNNGIVGVYKVNLLEKTLNICYDVKYPTGKYEDITFEEGWKVVLHKKNGEKYVLDL